MWKIYRLRPKSRVQSTVTSVNQLLRQSLFRCVGETYEFVGYLLLFSLNRRPLVVLFFEGFCFCFCFQGFVLVPSNPETPSKSRVFFVFSSACTRLQKSLFPSRLSLEVAEHDARIRDAWCVTWKARNAISVSEPVSSRGKYKSARNNFRSLRTRSSSGVAFRSSSQTKMWTVLGGEPLFKVLCGYVEFKKICSTGRRALRKTVTLSLFRWSVYWLQQLDDRTLIRCFSV